MLDMKEKLEVIAHLSDHITYKEDIGICYDSALAKVIEDAYMTLQKGVTVQEWISVKDRLPERFENVLCYFPEKDYGSAVMVDYNESTREEITVFASQFKWGKVSHWMPLPQPPKGE